MTIEEAGRRRSNRKSKFQAALRRADKTQAKVADTVGVDESTISRYKSGVRDPSLSSLRAMARQGIDVMDVFGIKTGEPVVPRKKGLRSKAHGSVVSNKMREASRIAQETNKYYEPQ